MGEAENSEEVTSQETEKYDTTLILGGLCSYEEKVVSGLQRRGASVETVSLPVDGSPEAVAFREDILQKLQTHRYSRVLIGTDDIRNHKELVNAIISAQIESGIRTLLVPTDTQSSKAAEGLPVYISALVPFVVDDPYRFEKGLDQLAKPLPPRF